MVEYISAKGSKRLAIVNRRVGAHIEVSYAHLLLFAGSA
jgi:hypothetical protein